MISTIRRSLHKKKVYIPLLIISFVIIAGLVTIPSLPALQSTAQEYTKSHPTVAKVVPQYFKQPDLGIPAEGNWLVIPGASLKMAINEGDSIKVLNNNKGVWHQTGTTDNNYVLAGHRKQFFRSINESLYHLDRLKVGYTGLYLVIDGKQTQYKVISTKIVPLTDVSILNPSDSAQLTIYTCNDFNNQRRLVVTAVPIKDTPITTVN